jgi:hypothetical protein
VPTYLVAGIGLDIEIDLPELPLVDPDAVPATVWTVAAVDEVTTGPTTTEFEHLTLDERMWCRVSLGVDAVLLEFPQKVDFAVRREGRRVEMAVAPDLAPTTLRHLVIDQLVPHLLSLAGDVVLHASAVAVDGRALAFLGPSGAGKSSLAAGFVQQGAELLADDFLVVRREDGRYLTTAAYPGLRLWEDSAAHFAEEPTALPRVAAYNDKRRWAVDPPTRPADVPLGALLVLGSSPERDDEPTCQLGRVLGRDAFLVVYQQAFRVGRSGRDRQQTELDWFADLAQAVPVLLVEHRRSYEALPAVIDEIHAALGRLGATGPG